MKRIVVVAAFGMLAVGCAAETGKQPLPVAEGQTTFGQSQPGADAVEPEGVPGSATAILYDGSGRFLFSEWSLDVQEGAFSVRYCRTTSTALDVACGAREAYRIDANLSRFGAMRRIGVVAIVDGQDQYVTMQIENDLGSLQLRRDCYVQNGKADMSSCSSWQMVRISEM